MAASGRRWQDTVMLVYFALQIPSTIFFDTQGVYPESWYPSWLRWLRAQYLSHHKDPFLNNAWDHPWYLSVCLVEHFIEVPFFFWASWAFYQGVKAQPSIIVPTIMYCVHTVTIVLAVWSMALLADFSSYPPPAPGSLWQRLVLCSAYSPFMVTCLFGLWDLVPLCKDKITFRDDRDSKQD